MKQSERPLRPYLVSINDDGYPNHMGHSLAIVTATGAEEAMDLTERNVKEEHRVNCALSLDDLKAYVIKLEAEELEAEGVYFENEDAEGSHCRD